jgi:uncharacterized protein (DUF4415 family)
MKSTKSESSARGKQIKKKRKSTKQKIDFSDIPELSDDQLSSMKRVGRPPLGQSSKLMIAFRIDPAILDAIRKLAAKKGKGYQVLIHDILENFVNKKAA